MKCINRRLRRSWLCLLLTAALIGCSLPVYAADEAVADYETAHYNKALYQADLKYQNLCITAADVDETGFTPLQNIHAAGLFDLKNKSVVYGKNLFTKTYPASITKIMTALLAIEKGDLNAVVTVGPDVTHFAADESTVGLKAGDRITLHDLLYGLLVHSGNDCGVAIAEYISGSLDGFVELMNARAGELMATDTHFVNPHGLHDPNHYTTAYDLYLIFNECIKHQEFLDVIQTHKYTATITDSSGGVHKPEWESTNLYFDGTKAAPAGYRLIGGKTGTTKPAGNCLILYSQAADQSDAGYISVVLGADTRPLTYDNMTAMLTSYRPE